MPKRNHRAPVRTGGRVLRRFTLSCFALLLVPIALLISAYASATNLTEKHIMESNHIILDHAMQRLENSVSEAARFTITLSSMSDIAIAMQQSDPLNPESVYAINRAIDQLPAFTDANNIITGYCLYSSDGNYLLAPSKAYLNIGRYYENSLQYEGMDYASYRETVLDMKNVAGFLPETRHIHLSTKFVHSVTMFRPYIPVTPLQSGRMAGKAIFFLDVPSIQALLEPAMDLGAEWIYIVDKNDVVLMSLGAEGVALDPNRLVEASIHTRVTVDGREMSVSHHRGAGTGLQIVIFTPMSAVLGRVSALTRTLLIIMLTLLAIGVGLVFWVTGSNSRPLINIIGRLPENESERDDMASLWDVDRAIHRLTDRETLLRKQLEEQKMQMRSALIRTLVGGGDLDESTLEVQLHHVDLFIEGTTFRGAYMEIDAASGFSKDTLTYADHTQEAVLKVLSRYVGRIKYLAMHDFDHYILIYSAEQTEAEYPALSSLFGEIYNQLHMEYGLQPRFFLGNECTELKLLYRSFGAALNLMEATERSGGQYLHVLESEKMVRGYRYTVRDEQKLITLANKGRISDIRAELDLIYQMNFLDTQLDCFMQELLYHRMIATLAQNQDYEADSGEMERMLRETSPRAFFAALEKAYGQWCDAQAARIEAGQNELIQNVLSFIHENYTDDSMGLAAAALRFNVTESYLSSFFKEKVGKTFSAYLESVRIQNANQLLVTTDSTIDEIAHDVGYCNADSFRRAYKRVHGYAPSKYRQGM